MFKSLCISLMVAISPLLAKKAIEEKPMVVIIPSYNNEKWVEQNLVSVFDQRYTNYRVIYIDDHSTDGTYDKVKRMVDSRDMKDRVTLIRNEKNQGALKNLYEAIHSCRDEEIVVTLDGDDWFATGKTLSIVNRAYSGRRTVWLTHGTYMTSAGGPGINRPASIETILNNTYREDFQPSHLRTFYAWLFKKIKKEDLLYNGEFYPMAWDLAMLFPMFEMAAERQAYIPRVLYMYNVSNPISDFVKDRGLQLDLDKHIRSLPKYKRLDSR